MTDITLLTRKPQDGKNDWVIAGQEKNSKTGAPWRTIVWGKGRFNIKGMLSAEVDTDFDIFYE